jgi:hypothetical protein
MADLRKNKMYRTGWSEMISDILEKGMGKKNQQNVREGARPCRLG